MAQPVWVLSVDLQTRTATFQSGMADAAKSARGAFSDIKSGSSEMSGHVGGNMFATRHAVMAVSEAYYLDRWFFSPPNVPEGIAVRAFYKLRAKTEA